MPEVAHVLGQCSQIGDSGGPQTGFRPTRREMGHCGSKVRKTNADHSRLQSFTKSWSTHPITLFYMVNREPLYNGLVTS